MWYRIRGGRANSTCHTEMKLIYTHENRFLVNNMKNIVEGARIPVVLRNEYAIGGVGDLSPFDVWLELWVMEDEDYDLAMRVIQDHIGTNSNAEWTCNNCGERNASSFDICWNCQHAR